MRTRDPQRIAHADFAVDVGGVWDAGTGRFDHHQKGFAGELLGREGAGLLAGNELAVVQRGDCNAGSAAGKGSARRCPYCWKAAARPRARLEQRGSAVAARTCVQRKAHVYKHLKPIRALFLLGLAASLLACADGKAATAAESERLPDESGQVERVQNKDPRDYFIANKRALGAVDADGDGVWDDVQARLAVDISVKEVDARALRQMALAYQGALLYKTRAEARTSPMPFELAGACVLHRALSAGASPAKAHGLRTAAETAVERALFVTKERVLANAYSSAMAGGGSFSAAPRGAASCQ